MLQGDIMPVIVPHLERDKKPDGMNANLSEESIWYLDFCTMMFEKLLAQLTKSGEPLMCGT
jgi:hypothetical protein